MLSSEGSLTILHIFFPPTSAIDIPPGCAAWRLADSVTTSSLPPSHQHHSSTAPHHPSGPHHHRSSPTPTRALAAVAWGTSVSVYSVALTRLRPASQSPRGGSTSHSTASSDAADASPRPSAPAPLDPPQLLAVFPTENHPVSGLGFIGAGALAVATADGEVETEITLWHPATFPNYSGPR